MEHMNNWCVSGIIGQDPKETPKTATFSLAVNKTIKTATGQYEQKTSWFTIEVRGEGCKNYVLKNCYKGLTVMISAAELSQENYEDKATGEKKSFIKAITYKVMPVNYDKTRKPEKLQDDQWKQEKSNENTFTTDDGINF